MFAMPPESRVNYTGVGVVVFRYLQESQDVRGRLQVPLSPNSEITHGRDAGRQTRKAKNTGLEISHRLPTSAS